MTRPKPQNLLFILSDEHNRKITGCYGHPIIKTPNIDRLAADGTRFDWAYCNSPICVPSRASLATGQYVHDIGFWDNAAPYTGEPPSWHQVLRDNGVDVVSIGKLHFRGGDDYGFTEELLPLHVVGGIGDLKGLFRNELSPRTGTSDLAAMAGRGDSTYSAYDSRIADMATDWITRRSRSGGDKRFVLFVSFVMPHFPLIAPGATYDLYEDYGLADLAHRLDAPPPDHPTLNRMRNYFDYYRYFDDETRAIALRAYFGMVTRLDELIGDVIASLRESGFADDTRILYTSDHGDNLGNRDMWGKSVMYEDAVGVPMIMTGDGIPAGRAVTTPVSLLDIAPTALAATGVSAAVDYPGCSLIELANTADPERVVMAEYHAAGSDTGQFMIRKRNWKYVAFVGARPQLFDLADDPDELNDLGEREDMRGVVAELDADLRAICDPVEVDARAFRDQQATIDAAGGIEGINRTVDIPFTPAPS
ncbi:MAG: sulfatase-like hydrolase/transferase [Hyphomicrobiales bacterium]|nr:sulfatase-like hydrolase/transferase [Hyphomicrobiales bacterium]